MRRKPNPATQALCFFNRPAGLFTKVTRIAFPLMTATLNRALRGTYLFGGLAPLFRNTHGRAHVTERLECCPNHVDRVG